jgi:hypothetical protein
MATKPRRINVASILKLKTPWPESARQLYRLSDRRLSAKLAPNFTYRGFHVVSVTDPYDRIFGFLDRSRYIFFKVAPQLYSRGWVDPVPDPLLLRKFYSAGDWTRTSGSVAGNTDHRRGLASILLNWIFFLRTREWRKCSLSILWGKAVHSPRTRRRYIPDDSHCKENQTCELGICVRLEHVCLTLNIEADPSSKCWYLRHTLHQRHVPEDSELNATLRTSNLRYE